MRCGNEVKTELYLDDSHADFKVHGKCLLDERHEGLHECPVYIAYVEQPIKIELKLRWS